jgi:hypothetical protein
LISYTNDNSLKLQNLGLEIHDRTKMICPREAATYLGVSEYNLAQWRQRGTYDLPFVHEGKGRVKRPMYKMGDVMDLKARDVIRIREIRKGEHKKKNL